MTWRMPGRAQHHHRAVAEYILVEDLRLDLALTLDPAFERLEVHAFGWLGRRDRVPFPGADQEGRLRKRSDLAGVIGVIVADADIFDLVGFDIDLCQEIDQTDLRCDLRSE